MRPPGCKRMCTVTVIILPTVYDERKRGLPVLKTLCVCVFVGGCIHLNAFIFVCLCACAHACMCVCVCGHKDEFHKKEWDSAERCFGTTMTKSRD